MASTVLSILHEFLSPRVPYCTLPPLVYFELGFSPSSATCVRLVIGLTKPISDPLVENFVLLCTGLTEYNGRALSYKHSAVETLDSLNGTIYLGEELPAVGQRSGRAATESGLLDVKTVSDKPEDVAAGTVIMLPYVMNSSRVFTSVFYVTTQKQTIYEGEVIGHVEEGLSELNRLLLEYGTPRGRPKTPVIVQDCGQL